MPRAAYALLAFAVAMLAACGGVREVRTQPPRPAVAVADSATVPDRTALAVTFAIAEALPPEVAALRLRVAALWLQPTGEAWQKRPVDSGAVESGDPPVRLLAADVPRRRYDSLAVVLAEPFVTFGPNAGGPLTIPDSGLIRVPLALDLAGRSRAEIRLRLDPALTRDSTGAWRFQPRLTVQD